jgi:hypothetical protein
MSTKVKTRSEIVVASGPSAAIRPEPVTHLLGARTELCIDDEDEAEIAYGDMHEAVGVFGVVLTCGAAWAAAVALWWLF